MPIISKRKLTTNVAAYAPAVSAWTPASVTTDVWFDADDAATITASAGAVSQWNDKSGNARHAFQATTADKPTDVASVQNGKHGLLMDQKFSPPGSGAGSWIQIPSFTRAQPFIMCAAFKVRNNTYWSTLWDGNAPAAAGTRCLLLTNFDDGTNNSGISNGTTNVYGGGIIANNTPCYFTGLFDGANSKFRKNGTQVGTGSFTTGISASSMFGSWIANTTADGWLLEFFIIPGNSTTDITNAETYLAAKWAI